MVANEAEMWSALGDATRRAIVQRLAAGPCAVAELAAELPISRPAVSQHLKVLKEAGLVSDRAVGTRRIYQLEPEGLRAWRAELERFWTQTLRSYQQKVESPRRGKR